MNVTIVKLPIGIRGIDVLRELFVFNFEVE